jgi:hypothetical protein
LRLASAPPPTDIAARIARKYSIEYSQAMYTIRRTEGFSDWLATIEE